MRIVEFQDSVDTQKLAALSQFLLARADDTGAKKTISVDAFLKLANDQGISLTREGLIELSQKPPLSNLIQTVESDRIVFSGAEDEQVTDTMTVDQARKTVDTMAKRAAKKGL